MYLAARSPPGCAVPRPSISLAESAVVTSRMVSTLTSAAAFCSAGVSAAAGLVATAVACPNAYGATSATISRSADNLRPTGLAKGFDFIDEFSRLTELPRGRMSIRSGGRNCYAYFAPLIARLANGLRGFVDFFQA